MRRRHFSLADASAEADRDFDSNGTNPLEMVANLSDVMLVLAVALMIALISHWSVDISNVTQIGEQNMKPIEADIVDGDANSQNDGSAKYEEVGKVYKDVDTGELYVLQ